MAASLSSPEQIWRTYDAMESRLSTPLTERMLELAHVSKGMRVLDVASGRGDPAIPAARRVGPTGFVFGLDLSPEILTIAREKAAHEGLVNLELRAMDAASTDADFPRGFDCALIRWALMYMEQPSVALAHVRLATRAGGALVIAVWAPAERVPYFTLPRQVLKKYREVPETAPDAPGVFRYATSEALRRDLEHAGFRIQHEEELEVPVMEVATTQEAVAWVRAFGLTKLLNDLPEETQAAWEADFAQEMEARRKDGVLQLGGVTRVVVAT